MKSRYNMIPEAVTVTLSASAFYNIVHELERLRAEMDTQLDGITLNKEDNHVQLRFTDIIPFEENIKVRIAELLAADDEAMDMIAKAGTYAHNGRYGQLDSYSWSYDLRRISIFKEAWERAKQRIE